MSEEQVFEELICHLVINELNPEEYAIVSQALNCKRGGINPTTKKSYISMLLDTDEDWSIADTFMSEHSSTFQNRKISYAAFSKMTWGKFQLPKRVIKFAEKHDVFLDIQFATPSRKK